MNTITKQLTQGKILVNWLAKLPIHLVWGASKHLLDLIPAKFDSIKMKIRLKNMMIILDESVVKIIRLKIPAMQDLIRKKPNCQEAWQSSSKIEEFPNLGENAKILRMQVWKWSILLQSFVRWPAPSENEKKWREWKSESEKYEKVKVMRTHSEFCMLACTSTFSHSSFVSFPSVSLLTALGFFLTF